MGCVVHVFVVQSQVNLKGRDPFPTSSELDSCNRSIISSEAEKKRRNRIWSQQMLDHVTVDVYVSEADWL